ncbi:MAG TPA: ArsA family ATPase [Thermoanaerobaculia bacterium]|nr:ArsA family ATPase [Thermoanaerobaculia bacterium]
MKRSAPHAGGPAGFRFVAGKGGVGKTTLAAARAIGLADAGLRVLVVSTDPAHSLGDALFGAAGPDRLSGEPRAVERPGKAGELLAVELDSRLAWRRWLGARRAAIAALAERGTLLDAEDVSRLLDLPVPGVDELVGILELIRLAGESGCDRVVVDTAPTAHTLRLLQMPAALERFAAVLAALEKRHRAVSEALTRRRGPGAVDADPTAGRIEREAHALADLVRDPERCTFTWVLLPELLSLAESHDALAELEDGGVTVDELVVNRVTPPPPMHCSACEPRRRAEAAVVRQIRQGLARGRELHLVPELEEEPRGSAALRRLGRLLAEGWDPEWETGRETEADWQGSGGARLLPGRGSGDAAAGPREPLAWLGAVAPPGIGLLLFGGKGGVGKTTCAAAAALAAARAAPERGVLLLSTDPAHSVADVLGVALGDVARPVPGAPAGFRARELDAGAAFAARKERYGAALERAFSGISGRSGGAGYDVPFDRAVLERLLEATPPGLDELVALSELAELTALPGPGKEACGGPSDAPLVVVDTAPAGHTLRLLELPELALEWDHALLALLLKYKDAVGLPADWAEELLELARELKRLRALLGDAGRCRFVIVTRAGELPRRQTRRLAEALGRLRIAAPVVIFNALPVGECARCRRARGRALDDLAGLRSELGDRAQAAPGSDGGCHILTAPAEYPPPRGTRALERWSRHWSSGTPGP